ncbi:hypothetical protein GQ457_02G024030 [Hibiscus cannabinus]
MIRKIKAQRNNKIFHVPIRIHVQIPKTRGRVKTTYIEFLDNQQILLVYVIHELTNKLYLKALRSNRQIAKRTPSFLNPGVNAPMRKNPEKITTLILLKMTCLDLESQREITLRSLLSPPE